MSLNIAEKINIFGLFQELVGLVNESVTLAILGAIAEQADAR